MNPQEPVVPDPDQPLQTPGAPVGDPADPDRPSEYDLARPPAASEPGTP